MTNRRGWLVVVALCGLFYCLLSAVAAHEFYPWECCSDQDCAPLPEGSVTESAEGFTLKASGEFIERAKAKLAPDGRYHLCRNPSTNTIICFFQPDRGV